MPSIQQVIADKTAPSAIDVFIHDTLVGMGYAINYVSDEDPENTAGCDGVVVCESVIGSTLANKYDTAPVPIITHEFSPLDDWRLVDIQNIGSSAAGDTINVTGSTHPIMNGPYGAFSGSTVVASVGVSNVYTDTSTVTVASGVNVLAQNPTTAALKYVLACDAGANLTTGTAANKRGAIGYPFNGDVPSAILANGLAIMKNAYVWAFGPVSQSFEISQSGEPFWA